MWLFLRQPDAFHRFQFIHYQDPCQLVRERKKQ